MAEDETRRSTFIPSTISRYLTRSGLDWSLCVSAPGVQQGAAEALHTSLHPRITFMGRTDSCAAILLKWLVISLIGGHKFTLSSHLNLAGRQTFCLNQHWSGQKQLQAEMRDYTLCLNPDNNKIRPLMLIDTITGRSRLYLVKLGYLFGGFKGIKIILFKNQQHWVFPDDKKVLAWITEVSSQDRYGFCLFSSSRVGKGATSEIWPD